MFWRFLWLFRQWLPNRNFANYCWWSDKRQSPYWKFKPFIYYDYNWKAWRIYWKDNRDYSKNIKIEVEAHIDVDTGHIIGIDLYDELTNKNYNEI